MSKLDEILQPKELLKWVVTCKECEVGGSCEVIFDKPKAKKQLKQLMRELAENNIDDLADQ